ncbi:hypothetical protein F8G81_18155 [Arthrobacter sp. CDRTa11]|uniref:hypothetical protein n=1 Tax=Arthrobacter sp. CDRTa11 TaxID=2651199 RepID=UPI002265D9E1|nr:hypothetical protein [Arthrobacter sp. CDRTa11]UZX04320.1 hypothetical protein F8G81_18155 [Arthrobacter sp. CDRTa11]
MMYLTYSKRRRPGRPGGPGGVLRDAGWTGLSIAAAVILLPAIGTSALARAILRKGPDSHGSETDRTHYLIT